MAAQLPGLQNQALALSTELNNLQGQIQTLEGDLKSELLPLDDQLEALEKQVKTKTSEIKTFAEQLEAMAKALGAQVEKARPLSPELTELYQKLDMILSKVDFKAEAKNDVSSNLRLAAVRRAHYRPGDPAPDRSDLIPGFIYPEMTNPV